MKFEVMSRRRIEEYADEYATESSIVISIHADNNEKADIRSTSKNRIKDILFLRFADVDKAENNGIQPEHASQIREFIEFNMECRDFSKIIIQCGAGQSRSAGVAAALMKFYNKDDTPIFNNPRYTPNMLCYRTVLEEMYNG